MNRKSFGVAIIVVSLLAPLAVAQNTIRCESDYNRRKVCTFSGWGRPALSRQLSKTACIEGRTWGRDGRNGVWVSDGCRAEFIIAREGYNDRGSEVVVCRSYGRRTRCDANTRSGVQLSRQISNASCVEGRSWGYDDNGIWVDHGCGAEFVVGNSRGNRRDENDHQRNIIVCESINNTRHNCSADTRYGVELSRQLSKNDCVLNRTWGYDSRGIWVTNGCRGEFVVGR
jgi:hypothetical protein